MIIEQLGGHGIDPSVLPTYFFMLDPGCYDVVIVPRKEDGTPSTTCPPTVMNRVVVLASTTTEIAMASQCDPPGGVPWDDPGWNALPAIAEIELHPAETVAHCKEQTACVTVVDLDRDPVELVWSQEHGTTLAAGPATEPMIFDPTTGKTTQCATMIHDGKGTVGISVKVYDLMPDASGNLVRIEDYYAQMGAASTSHDVLTFSSHAVSAEACP